MKKYDPLLRTRPWKIYAVFGPLESILNQIEKDGTVMACGNQIVFLEDGSGGWYDAVAALHGVIEFHQIAEMRYGLAVDTAQLIKLANKLDSGAPIFESDIQAARESINHCKRQAGQLRESQACDLVDTVRISMEMDKIREARVAA